MLAAALERMVNAESKARFFLAPLPLAASSRECIIIERARPSTMTSTIQEIDLGKAFEDQNSVKYPAM